MTISLFFVTFEFDLHLWPTNCSKNITPPQFCGGVKTKHKAIHAFALTFHFMYKVDIFLISYQEYLYTVYHVLDCKSFFLYTWIYQFVWCSMLNCYKIFFTIVDICFTLFTFELSVHIGWILMLLLLKYVPGQDKISAVMFTEYHCWIFQTIGLCNIDPGDMGGS